MLQPNNSLYDRLLEEARLSRQKKAADADAYQKALKEAIPEWSFLWNAQMSKRKDTLLTRGGDLVGKGINNPWVGTDEESRNFVKDFTAFTQDAKQSMRLQAEYEKIMDDIRTRGDQYTEESKASEIGKFYNNSLDDFLSGKVKLEPLQFKTPVTNVIATESALVKGWNEINTGKLMTPDDAYKLASDTSVGEAYKGYNESMQQLWISLSQNERDGYLARGVNQGDKTGFITFKADRIMDRSGVQSGDLSKIASDIAAEIKTDKSGRTYEDPTTGSTTGSQTTSFDRATTRQALKARFLRYSSLIDQDIEKGLYGSKTMNPDQKLSAALDYHMKEIENQVTTGTITSTTYSGSGGAQTAADIENANTFVKDYRGYSGDVAALNAANRLVTQKMRGGEVAQVTFDFPTKDYRVTLSKTFLDNAQEDFPDIKDREKLTQLAIKKALGVDGKSKILENGDVQFTLSKDLPLEAVLGVYETSNKGRKIPYGAVKEPTPDANDLFDNSKGKYDDK